MYKHRVLLLNAANMESLPVYPYVFAQVPAVARRANIELVCQDLLGVPAGEWHGDLVITAKEELAGLLREEQGRLLRYLWINLPKREAFHA